MLNSALNTVDSSITTINSALNNKANSSELTSIKQNIQNLSAVSNFGNYQFQFKDPSGIMLLASSVHARDMARDNNIDGYSTTLNFKTAFVKQNPIVIVSESYPSGFANTSVLWTSLTQLKIGCKVNINAFYISWIAIGLWK